MACEVRNFGTIRDLHKVQEYFGLPHDDNWLHAINIAISPTGELIALTHGEKLAFLSANWDNVRQVSTYALSWCGELEDVNQIITSVICLPMHGSNVSSGAEWTCVVLGLSSGMVMFYTDAGIKIFSQSFHDIPVLAVKCFSPPRRSTANTCLCIVYNECVCTMKGNEVFPLLSAFRRNHHSHPKELRTSGDGRSTLTATADLMQFQKFKFTNDRKTIMNDAVIIDDNQNSNTYDHLIEQAICSGGFARVSETPTQRSQVVSVGVTPYIGFYFAEEGYKTISLRAVAKDVIGVAYKNILSNFFGRNTEPSPSPSAPSSSSSSPTDGEDAKAYKESEMRTRCRLYDGKRDGYTIALAPGGKLAAVTDNLDRVMLVDTQRATVLRVWKGYHDAQCAFVPVKENSLKGVQTQKRCALFLVLYAPRLGCLEIWALQHGPRIAAFTVTKSGQLCYNTHKILASHGEGKSPRVTSHCCLFFDPSDGSVKEIRIPFHYALSEGNSQTSRDIHLLRKLRSTLRDIDYGHNSNATALAEIKQLAGDFQTVEVRQQCLEILRQIKQLRPMVFRTIVEAFAESLEHATIGSDAAIGELKGTIDNYRRLVDFYIAMKQPQQTTLTYALELDDCDIVIIKQLIDLLSGCGGDGDDEKTKQTTSCSPVAPTVGIGGGGGKVRFKNDCREDGDFIDYLSIFQMKRDVCSDGLPLDKTKAHLFSDVSGKLFAEFYEHGLAFNEFKVAAAASTIPYADLLALALHSWIEKPFCYKNCDEVLKDMSRLAAVVHTICELAGDDCVNAYAYNAISPWWQEVREMLLESPKSLGLLVAIVCKFVATSLRQSYKEGSADEGSANEEDEHWERISHDEAQWSLLIGKLEDVAILGAILENPEISAEPVMPELTSQIPDCSLKFIVNGGKGIVTDLTAQWLINSRIHPSKILENESDDESAAHAQDEAVLVKLALLREHYPFSLESGVLLCVMAWHYMVHWSKNLQSIEYMRATLTCLEQFRQEDWALKHGICCLLWNATLKFPLHDTAKLFQKVGRMPSDKMCYQDFGMSAANVPEFLGNVYDFLQHFAISLEHEKRDLHFDESLAEGQQPVQFLALQQHNALRELLQLQTELCCVLHFMAFFQLKFAKPLTTLFDAMSNRAFQLDINKEMSFVLRAPDLSLQKQREKFLCNVVSATIDLIREDLESLYVQDHVFYMERVNVLADYWSLEKTALRRRQIVEMYAHGYDAHGEALLLRSATNNVDIETICHLLEIAGRRLQLYSRSSQAAYLNIASVGPTLLQYLDKLSECSNAPNAIQISACAPADVDLSALTKLISHCFKFLNQREEHLIHIAAQMFDACRTLQDM